MTYMRRMTPTMTLVIGLGVYIKRILTALSVLINVILGGQNNQTFSARNHQWQREGKPNVVYFIDMLIGKGHCVEAWVYWKVRRKW
jgi:hypothetical protein